MLEFLCFFIIIIIKTTSCNLGSQPFKNKIIWIYFDYKLNHFKIWLFQEEVVHLPLFYLMKSFTTHNQMGKVKKVIRYNVVLSWPLLFIIIIIFNM